MAPGRVSACPAPQKPAITQNGNQLISSDAKAYQWYLNSQPFPDATNKTFFPLTNGMYLVEITGNNGCKSRSDEIDFKITSIEDNSTDNPYINISPNPTDGTLLINITGMASGKVEIYMKDILGNVVLSLNLFLQENYSHQELDMNSRPAGVYFIEIISSGNTYFRKFIKQ